MIYKPPLPAAIMNDSPRGYALLLAVVITSAVLSSASAIAGIVVSEIRQTRITASAISARASAEAEAERALLLLRHTNIAPEDMGELVASDTEISSYAEPYYFNIPQNDFVSLPIPTGTDSAEITPRITGWVPDTTCAEGGSWIEITTISWDDSIESPDSPFRTSRQPYSFSSNRETLAEPDTIVFPTGTPVELRIRALYCDIDQLAIEGIPGRYRVITEGREGDSVQALETLLTREAPGAGPFDFVLFSECDVRKGVGGVTCP